MTGHDKPIGDLLNAARAEIAQLTQQRDEDAKSLEFERRMIIRLNGRCNQYARNAEAAEARSAVLEAALREIAHYDSSKSWDSFSKTIREIARDAIAKAPPQ